MKFQSTVLFAPEIVMETSGIACGDAMKIHAFRDNGKIYFTYTGKACDVSNKVAQYLERQFSGQMETDVEVGVRNLRSGQFTGDSEWIKDYYDIRRYCVESPISLLSAILLVNEKCDLKKENFGNLACDACVKMRKIVWDNHKKKEKQKKFLDVLRNVNHIDSNEDAIQEMAICVLSDIQKKNFENSLFQVDEHIFKMIKKLRLAAPLFNNSISYNLLLDDKIIGLAIKQKVSLAVSVINKYIESNNLLIDAVKGGKTSDYYPSECFRAHMDYDYLAANIEDAFQLISFLINERGFKFILDASVPFSIKSVMDYSGEEVLTGHIHLEKILQNKYQVVVDINMGGFPLGRSGIIRCNACGKVEIEDLVCITLAHLFKHEHAFIKDINDLYYLLNSKDIKTNVLEEKLELYHLTFLFTVAYDFLKRELGLKRAYKRYNFILLKSVDKKWPYSRKAHFYIKLVDLWLTNIKKFGFLKGFLETNQQVCGQSGIIKSRQYFKICSIINERTYLYPILIFNKIIGLHKIINSYSIGDSILIYNDILILPIGLFYMQNTLSDEATRSLMEKDVIYIIKELEISAEDFNFDYVMQARMDTWLY